MCVKIRTDSVLFLHRSGKADNGAGMPHSEIPKMFGTVRLVYALQCCAF